MDVHLRLNRRWIGAVLIRCARSLAQTACQFGFIVSTLASEMAAKAERAPTAASESADLAVVLKDADVLWRTASGLSVDDQRMVAERVKSQFNILLAAKK